jgi:hypothetical protein
MIDDDIYFIRERSEHRGCRNYSLYEKYSLATERYKYFNMKLITKMQHIKLYTCNNWYGVNLYCRYGGSSHDGAITKADLVSN